MLIILLLINFSFTAFTQVHLLVDLLSRENQVKIEASFCPENDEEILCSNLSESICQELWDPKNKGHLVTPNGELNYGKSAKSETSSAKIMDLRAFVNAKERFPAELREDEEYKGLIEKLQRHVDNENSSSEWGEELALLNYFLSLRQKKIAKEMVFKSNPALRVKEEKEYSSAEWDLIRQGQYDIETKILEAKYKNSEKWKRVERIYFEMKANLITVIRGLQIPEDNKKRMISKVESIEISLPYTDPKLLGSDESCAKDKINAFYSPRFNKFTVCIGDLHASNSEGAMAFTIGHELSHGIDLEAQANDLFQKEQIVVRLKSLMSDPGRISSCKKWNKMLNDGVFQIKSIPSIITLSPFDEFKKCIVDKSRIKDFNEENVGHILEQFAVDSIDRYATKGSFAYSLTSELNIKDEKRPNDDYLTPGNWHKLSGQGHLFNPPIIPIFMHAMVCRSNNDKPRDISNLSDAEKENSLDAAVETTRKIAEAFFRTQYSICTDECSDLDGFKVSKSSGENFSDWFGSKAAALYMAKLPHDKRRSFAREMGAFTCEMPEYSYDPAFMRAQKKYSSEVHSDSKIRRNSLFMPEIAALAGCKLDTVNTKGFNLCKL